MQSGEKEWRLGRKENLIKFEGEYSMEKKKIW